MGFGGGAGMGLALIGLLVMVGIIIGASIVGAILVLILMRRRISNPPRHVCSVGALTGMLISTTIFSVLFVRILGMALENTPGDHGFLMAMPILGTLAGFFVGVCFRWAWNRRLKSKVVDSSKPPMAKPWQFRFVLVDILVLQAIIGVHLWQLSAPIRYERTQKAIKSLGFDTKGNPLRGPAGIEHIWNDLTAEPWQRRSITDNDVKQLTETLWSPSSVTHLTLDANNNEVGHRVTDTGLKHLARFRNVKYLGIQSSLVTEEGVQALRRAIPNADIGCGNYGKKGLIASEANAVVEILQLGGRFSISRGQDPEKHVDSVHIFPGVRLTDSALARFSELPELRELRIDGPQITDAGMKHLKGMSKLERLMLNRNQVTDAGLEHLKGLAHLRSLTLYGTQVTDAGVKRLRQALPKCSINH